MVETNYISRYPNTEAYSIFLDESIRFYRRTLESFQNPEHLYIRRKDLPRTMAITYFALKRALKEKARLSD